MIKVGQYIPKDDFDSLKGATNSLIELYLPTEMVIDRPQVVAPRVARVYCIRLWILPDGSVVNYFNLSRIEGFRGTSHHHEVLLFEVWEDYGDDGHVDYVHVGYMYLSDEYLPKDGLYPRDLQSSL